MRLSRSTTGLLAAIVLALAAGCNGVQAAPPITPDHDRPVPASEPRAEVTLVLDLEPAQGCEERFDLALYQDRRIDLVQWDEAKDACTGRRVTIRYLSAKLDRQELIQLVRKLARRASVAEQP
jgi:hypothetical protein